MRPAHPRVGKRVTIAISIFDVTPDMLPDRRPAPETSSRPRVRRKPRPAKVAQDPSTPGIELCLVRGYVRAAPTPLRDSYGIRTDQRRRTCGRCGIRYTGSNPEAGGTCRDCADVVDLISAEMKGWCNDTHAERA